MTRVAMGGTFDVLHRGHRALLDAAFAAGDQGVSIGVTTDEFANARRERQVRPYAERVADLTAFLRERGYLARADLRPIDTPVGFALEPQFDAVAVTEETASTAEVINQGRAQRGLAPLRIVQAPYVLGDDARPIKATRVRAGEVDIEGRLKRPVRIALGSDNPVKLEATRRAVTRLYGAAEVRGFAVDSNVAHQPFEEATWQGATTRARAALAAWPDADFGVGVEAGLFDITALGVTFDVQACVVIDRAGRTTHGQGPGFYYPESVAAELRKGRSVGDVVSQISGIPDIGKKTGAVGWLSRGHFTRTALTEPSVLMAFLPRLRPELYGL
ncbi:MAG: inosine/xanthosine triphosphatase [Candidatus Thermoplasmatota archaeon]